MPSLKTPRRVSKTALRAPRATKRRSAKRPWVSKPSETIADVLLVAQFAEALGQTVGKTRKPAHAGRRSLAEALQGSAKQPATDIVGLMPGVRIYERASAGLAAGPDALPVAPPVAPCFAAVQRRRRNTRIAGAASWCLAFAVTAGIVSAAAYGFVSQAPVPQPITTASAAQF